MIYCIYFLSFSLACLFVCLSVNFCLHLRKWIYTRHMCCAGSNNIIILLMEITTMMMIVIAIFDCFSSYYIRYLLLVISMLFIVVLYLLSYQNRITKSRQKVWYFGKKKQWKIDNKAADNQKKPHWIKFESV